MYYVWALVAILNILGFPKTPYNLSEIKGNNVNVFYSEGFCTKIIVFCDTELSI